MGAVAGNRWWVSLKHRIRDFATKHGRQLNLDRIKEAKSIENRISWAVAEVGGSQTVELARRDLECKTSEYYQGFVLRSRLKRVLNKTVKLNATAHEEEVQKFTDRYIDSVTSLDGRVLQSNREMRDAFRVHFHNHFARCPDLPLQEFRSYPIDFPHLGAAEAVCCEGVITECEVHDALITLLKKGGKHVWEGLDDYRPITLLNTKLKILARVLAI